MVLPDNQQIEVAITSDKFLTTSNVSQPTFDKSFVPQDSKSMAIDCHTVNCYPPIKYDMRDTATTYAFMITKTAMDLTNASIESKIQVFL